VAIAAETKRSALIEAATDLIRRDGYAAASVGRICSEIGVTKGAFFHHFESKEALALACLAAWNEQGVAMDAGAPYQRIADPTERVQAYMTFYIELFSSPELLKSCLAGTAAQEVHTSHPALRDGAHECLASATERLKALLDAACRQRRRRLDTASLASLWTATLQGALVLCKASQNDAVIGASLRHIKTYIESRLESGSGR